MNSISLALAAVRSRPLHSALSVTAAAAGIALLCAIFQLSEAVDAGLSRNARGIDVVAGAKGSPIQLVLSAIYHADVPNGNIEMEDYRHLVHNPQVKQAIPLALGDNYKGWRVVGTTPDYLSLFHAQIAEGRVFSQPFEAVAGALTGLAVGAKFAALHGFAAESNDVHNAHLYTIIGVLKPTGTVLDRLITTPLESVQQLHSHPDAGDPDAAEELELGHQVTAVLLKVKSPVAIMNLPREINRSTNILAASPSYQMARLSRSLGFGREVLTALGIGIVVLSMLMLLSTLASSLTARRYDLAVLRVLGASPQRLSSTVIAEGLVLSGVGSVTGLIAGHMVSYSMTSMLSSLRGIVSPATLLAPEPWDVGFLAIGLGAGLVAGLIPALSAARTDIAGLLARGRA
jgi:putative ABC transport system permease protein